MDTSLDEKTGAQIDLEEANEPDGEAAEDEARAWYVIHTYSGYENKVKENLEQRIKSMDVADKIFKVIIPTEDEVEIKGGQRRTVSKKVFPGYILVQMALDDSSWYVVRHTPGVTGFVGAGSTPTPLESEEVRTIINQMESKTPRVKVGFSKGQKVKIIDGPLNEFIGMVDVLFPDKGKMRVMVSIFGRETPVELDLLQVERM